MNGNEPGALREFHVARSARDFYEFDDAIYTFNGNVVFADFYAARLFSQKMNAKRDLVRFPEQAVSASKINALGLIDEILHLMVENYRRQVDPQVMTKALASLERELGPAALASSLERFAQRFPPVAVYRGESDLDAYLAGETGGMSHREVTLEELLMLWMANSNPAFAPYLELFDDQELEHESPYPDVVAGLRTFFSGQPGFGPSGESLFDLLQAPARHAPHSLEEQLEFIRGRWAPYVGARLVRVLSGLDFVAEEQKAIFTGPGPIEPVSFAGQEAEPEQYSPDTDWMPRLVLLAKNAYVWLDQLSKQYGRPHTTLADIPDSELDILARRGITGLWLIGLWERSRASRRIKQMMGNPEAVASAYSLHDYSIASDLGGADALDDLRQRAWQRGIRLASDMVPNHMAIDSRWVIEHPDWFLQLGYSPFPAYSFNGPNLNENDDRVGIYLEDHYYTRDDAAVVFKRVDHWTGDTRYIYHGNDGTTMPWNDTAQLNYLLPHVREAVIQTILHVARQFPVIRFDAAMTLAKRHIQRLWFPEPGSGGAIASRSEHGMSKAAFDEAIPNEFWREVVDRVAAEAPDTLLLAEAFWLLEGYFVRTLGMHRVYNSAFMHMLRDEDNDKYRQLIKNTVEFDPEILKRYVNFMSNPDEETAVAQFGKGDKYFGIATVLATVPGLPMFGHGQFEGFAEKYGMEYRRAYYDETPDNWLVDRHMSEIVPLLKRRYLFAEMQNFLLYDFFDAQGAVDENVLAFSNRAGTERSLVVYHNKFADTRGWIRTSAAYLDKGSGQLVQKSLGEGLGLPALAGVYVVFRDMVAGLEYIRPCRELVDNGMYIQLGAYQRHVFVDFREVVDSESHPYGQVAAYLDGRGTPSVEEAVKELYLRPLHEPYRDLVNGATLAWLFANRQMDAEPGGWTAEQEIYLAALEAKALAFLEAAVQFTGEQSERDVDGHDVAILRRRVEALEAVTSAADDQGVVVAGDAATTAEATDLKATAASIRRQVEAALRLPVTGGPVTTAGKKRRRRDPRGVAGGQTLLQSWLGDDKAAWGVLFGYVLNHGLGRAHTAAGVAATSRAWMDEWLLGKLTAQALRDFGLPAPTAERKTALVKVLIGQQDGWRAGKLKPHQVLEVLLSDAEVQRFAGVNRFDGVLWYNKESFAELLAGLFTTAAATCAEAAGGNQRTLQVELSALHELVMVLMAADAASGYRVETLVSLVAEPTPAKQKLPRQRQKSKEASKPETGDQPPARRGRDKSAGGRDQSSK